MINNQSFSDRKSREIIEKNPIRKQDLSLLYSFSEHMKETLEQLKLLWIYSSQEERQSVRLEMKKDLKQHLEGK